MKPKGFIFGGHVNGLGLVRSLAEDGIESVVFDTADCLAAHSKTASFVLCPDPSDEVAFIEFVVMHAQKQAGKPVIFVTNDIWLVPFAKNKAKLEPYMSLPMSDWNVISRCYDKEYMASFALEHDIPHPKSFFPKDVDEINENLEQLSYPVLLKPVETIGFREALGWSSRNKVIENRDDLSKVVSEMKHRGLYDRRVILQELIEGGVNSLYTFTSYSDKAGKVIAWSIGHKIRQTPPEAGTISAGKVVPNKQLEKIGIETIEKVGFHGIANTEFKLDSRTGEFKLIEINARPGMWNYSALSSGVNLPLLAYEDACGFSSYEFKGTTDKELVWINTIYDFLYFTVGLGCEKKYRLGFFERLKTLDGSVVHSIYSAKDVKPFLWLLSSFGKKALVKVGKLLGVK